MAEHQTIAERDEHTTESQHASQHEPRDSATAAGAGHGGAGEGPVEAMPLEQLFEPDELAQFDTEDVQAGANIGKMLALFFLYTVIVMSLVAWWTYASIVD